MADSGETIDTALPGITDLLKIIVVQKIMKDGTRKVIQISEVLGVDPNNKSAPLLNDLYVFDTDREAIYDEKGKIKEILGVHRRVGKLSSRTIKKMKLEGIHDTRFDFLTREVDENEEQEYTGLNIMDYGR